MILLSWLPQRFLRRIKVRLGLVFVLTALCLLIPALLWAMDRPWYETEKKKKPKPTPSQMTAPQLQSALMSYADRFANILSQSFNAFEQKKPTNEARFRAVDDLTYAMSAVFTIAAEPNPDVALLDMVVITTLGRMIYEEHWRPIMGPPADEMIRGFRILEEDIWKTTHKVLTKEQQEELRQLIVAWRRKYPEQVNFNYLRFADFAEERKQSKLASVASSGGLLAPVSEATKQIEEGRLLAERAIFLGTRLPLLSGDFFDVWITRWLTNPEVKKVLADVGAFSQTSESFGELAVQFPELLARERSAAINQAMEKISPEREAAINQLMDRVAEERKRTIEDFLAEEERVKGLLTEMRQVFTEANTLVLSTNTLVERLGIEPGAETEAGAESTFNVNDYRALIADSIAAIGEMQVVMGTLERIMTSPGMERLLTGIDTAVDRVGAEGVEIVDHTFQQGVILIFIFLGGMIVALLVFRFISERLFGSRVK